MKIEEKLLWYMDEYGLLIVLSLFYFAALSQAGYFLILRRSVFFGLVLTKLAQFSFILGFGLFSFSHRAKEHGHGYGHDVFSLINYHQGKDLGAVLFQLDAYVLPIFFVMLTLIIFLKERISKRARSSVEIFLAFAFIILSGLGPLTAKLFDANNLVISKAYFTEILYTPLSVLTHYLYFLVPLLFLLLLFFQRFLFISFAREQAFLSGLQSTLYNALLFFIIGALVAIAFRVLGFYLTLTALFIPPFLALNLFHKPHSSFLFSSVFSVLFALIAFGMAFLWDQFSTEALLILAFGLQAVLLYFLVFLLKKALRSKFTNTRTREL